uniref:Cation channel sperm-associated protein subunit delta n=2 Tax=Callorhinchus milii TaxID=7868 RepID=A0A4W3GQL8_CALMI
MVYLRRPKGFYLQLGPESGLPTEGLIGLLGRSHCDAVYPLKAGKKVLIAVLVWSRNSIYVGNINATFTRFNELKQSLSILNMPLDSNIDIVTVAFASRPVEFSILIQAVYQDYKRLMLIIVNDEENRWILSAMFSKLVNDSLPLNPLHMEFISSALSSVFVWNNNTIFYNLHDDKKNGKMHVNLDENISHAAEGSIIEQLVIDSNLNIIIKMSNNMLLHGVVGSDELVRLHVWEREDAKVTLYLTLLDQLYMIKVEDFKIRPTLYPLSMEKISSSLQTKSPPCPFIYFHHNKKSPIYNMDMTEELTFWAQIIYADNFGVEVEALILNHKLLELNYQINYQLHGRFYVNNKTITLTHNKDYRKAKNYMAAIKSTSGVLTLEFQPSMVSSSCIISSNTISFISVGCPPRKHIKVQRDHPVKCTFHDKQSYIISRHHVTNSLIDILAYYDKPRYGCPMQIHHKKSYKPTILLYIGEKLIEKVNVQYVIWEKYNRNDFSFNDSIKKVVCNSKTESILVKDRPHKMNNWKESIINPCTEFDYPNTSYMTLNSSSDRFLTWPTDHNALFLFHVKIVDPNFSFCNLTATFAIETYGVIIRDDIILVISLVWTFILILLCIFGYSYYKYIKIFRGMLSKPASNELYVGF